MGQKKVRFVIYVRFAVVSTKESHGLVKWYPLAKLKDFFEKKLIFGEIFGKIVVIFQIKFKNNYCGTPSSGK